MSVASEIQRIQAAKAGIKQSAENLGFDVPSSALISSYPQNIQKTPLTLTMSAITDGDDMIVDVSVSPIPSNVWSGFNCYGDWGCCNDNIVHIGIDGVMYACNLTDGKGQVVIPSCYGGTIGIDAVFVSTNYYSNFVSTSVTISGITVYPQYIDVQQLGTKVLVEGLPEDATGTVRVKIGDYTYTADTYGNYSLIDISGFQAPGQSNIQVDYSGDEKYSSAATTSTITVPKLDSFMRINIDDIYVGDRGVITVNVPDYATGNITIYVTGSGGGRFVAPIRNGRAVFETLYFTKAETCYVCAVYDGDDNYNSGTCNDTFTVS